MESKNPREDISKNIEKTVPEKTVTKEIAQKEEKIAKGVGEIPITRDELEERKRKVINYIKQKKDLVYYSILSIILLIAFYIRTRNIPKLKDITTGTWTLGPDLDPFLFLRWAKEIVEHGTLPLWDYMRYVPIGYNTAGEMKLLSYMIAWFYEFLSFFSNEVTVTYAAVVFPAVMFVFTGIAFFLFARKVFYREDRKTRNIIALIATSFFVLIPSLLPRTIAGIPEKESVAFFFMFMAFYLFLEAFTVKEFKKGLIFGVASGVTTGLMALVWGGFIFVYFAIPPVILILFILGKMKIKEWFIYTSWVVSSFLVMMPFSTRYSVQNLITSTSTGLGLAILGLTGIGVLIVKYKILENLRRKSKLPREIFGLAIAFLIVALGAIATLGLDFLIYQITHILDSLIRPMATRFGLTVAENKQPYFINDWKNSFGPVVMNIPLYFWMFFAGSVALFYNLVEKLKIKEKGILTLSYIAFLMCLIFSRYSSNSVLNGTSGLSVFIYFGGWLLLITSFVYVYRRLYINKELEKLKEFEFSYLVYFLVLTLGIIGARSGIRLVMVLGAISPVAVAFLIIKSSKAYLKQKDEAIKLFLGVVAVVLLISSLFTLFGYYSSDKAQAENFAPGTYQWQWQKAMEWVRNNTSKDAVFAHWWDYGYWLQSIGERATILDGGNAIVYWNHLMGRHVLTGPDEEKALEFLYTHNGTHLLIDSTEIGKYTAYSSIGADEDYDRFSWISTFFMNKQQTQETNNETRYIYTGGTALDEDIIWENNGEKIFLPKKQAGIGAIMIKEQSNGKIAQPEAIFVYQNRQYNIPLRYIYYEDELHDFNSGLEAGVFLFPLIEQSQGGIQLNKIGAGFYLSERTVHSQLAKLYLYGEKSDYFKLVHSEDSLIVDSLKSQGIEIKDFVYYQGFQGPIKIWEINYPNNIETNPDYLLRDYPNKEIEMAKEGEYN